MSMTSFYAPMSHVPLDPTLGTRGSLSWQNLEVPLGRDPRSEESYHLRSRPSRPQLVSRPPDTRSARPGQPQRPPPASRRTNMSLPRNSGAGLASASPLSIVRCLRAASSSWTPLCPLSATGLPGAAPSCSYLVSLRARPPRAPAPSEPRWTPHVVEAAQPPPPPCGGPHSCADPRGVASGCCYLLRVLMSPRAHRAGTPAPSEPR